MTTSGFTQPSAGWGSLESLAVVFCGDSQAPQHVRRHPQLLWAVAFAPGREAQELHLVAQKHKHGWATSNRAKCLERLKFPELLQKQMTLLCS